ncbi:hypothetical protein MPSEU_000392800 [Mayamaea pseudoterrestris]|nr:hypothetical protein MPSEU_000392800 [Mayamaea pseudoterrestris]
MGPRTEYSEIHANAFELCSNSYPPAMDYKKRFLLDGGFIISLVVFLAGTNVVAAKAALEAVTNILSDVCDVSNWFNHGGISCVRKWVRNADDDV